MRKLLLAGLAVAFLAGLAFAGFRVQGEFSGADGGEPTPVVCNYDPKTGLPLPGSHPMCPAVAP
ncbi:MAG TPA: hypothetical protein VFT91_05185, partial [Dehalococcoidia bacterium]|nr:hypothetical protein [Dehalococcoidia bacterium]